MFDVLQSKWSRMMCLEFGAMAIPATVWMIAHVLHLGDLHGWVPGFVRVARASV